MTTQTTEHDKLEPRTGWTILGTTHALSFEDLDEGLNGDFDAHDPNDVQLLRVDIYEQTQAGWEYAEGSSYCTKVPLSTPTHRRQEILVGLLALTEREAKAGRSARQIGARLSWADANFVDEAGG